MMNSANNMYMLLQLDNEKTMSEFFLFSIIQVHVIMLLNLITVYLTVHKWLQLHYEIN